MRIMHGGSLLFDHELPTELDRYPRGRVLGGKDLESALCGLSLASVVPEHFVSAAFPWSRPRVLRDSLTGPVSCSSDISRSTSLTAVMVDAMANIEPRDACAVARRVYDRMYIL
jgi:hypothetical protein